MKFARFKLVDFTRWFDVVVFSKSSDIHDLETREISSEIHQHSSPKLDK